MLIFYNMVISTIERHAEVTTLTEIKPKKPLKHLHKVIINQAKYLFPCNLFGGVRGDLTAAWWLIVYILTDPNGLIV